MTKKLSMTRAMDDRSPGRCAAAQEWGRCTRLAEEALWFKGRRRA
jgi:hypothetical protein